MSALVTIDAGRAVANSRDVAEVFEKSHFHVLRSIDGLIAAAPGLQSNFGLQNFEAVAGRGQGHIREYRAFTMDRDGFSLLAMGFTGAKALRWKIAYIEAFNAMETALADRHAPAVAVDHETWRVSLQFVREARSLGGRAAGRRAWAIAGLPDVFDEGAALRVGGYAADPDVADWFATRVERVAGIRAASSVLFADYQRWAADQERNAVSMVVFGKSLTALGVRGFNSNGIKREGVRLRQRNLA